MGYNYWRGNWRKISANGVRNFFSGPKGNEIISALKMCAIIPANFAKFPLRARKGF
jgi:hypothetical protein